MASQPRRLRRESSPPLNETIEENNKQFNQETKGKEKTKIFIYLTETISAIKSLELKKKRHAT
jgi:hypothetical protein